MTLTNRFKSAPNGFEIFEDSDSLGRVMKRQNRAKEEVVVCRCDGTSKEVRACLATSISLMDHVKDEGANDNGKHLQACECCSKSGLQRIAYRIGSKDTSVQE